MFPVGEKESRAHGPGSSPDLRSKVQGPRSKIQNYGSRLQGPRHKRAGQDTVVVLEAGQSMTGLGDDKTGNCRVDRTGKGAGSSTFLGHSPR
jgi:hypothetical protein